MYSRREVTRRSTSGSTTLAQNGESVIGRASVTAVSEDSRWIKGIGRGGMSFWVGQTIQETRANFGRGNSFGLRAG
jgi:hypothetical protein